MIKEKILDLLKKIIREDVEIKVEIPREKNFGDYSTNVAFLLARRSPQGEGGLAKGKRKNPNQIAQDLVKKIEAKKPDFLEKVKIEKGFINFYLKPEWLQKQVAEILNQKEKYGANNMGQNQKVQVEFISANPTGPLTIGNSRGGVIGDVLAAVLKKSDWQTTREYYFNDMGGQILALGHSVLKDDQAVYTGDYIDKLHKEISGKDADQVGKKAAQIIIKQIKKTTKNMGINFDVWTAEGKDLRDKGKVEKVIKWLENKKLAYKKDGAIWFRATKFSDDKDRVLVRKTGEPTYFGVDCAYHKNKFVERGFDKVIDVWGADHHGDIKRIKGFVKALGYADKFDIILHQFVRLTKDGKEVRMSKRKGIYVLTDDLVKEVGKDVFRFFMLQYSANSHLDFDLKLAKERSEKNPVFYVQYVSARIHGILAKLKTKNEKLKTTGQNLKLLKEPAELELIKQLIKFPDLVGEISQDYQVQKLPFYAIGLADRFHNFYEKCRVISKDNQKQQARLALISACQIVLKNCLALMGISAPEKM